jgi:protein gp37
VSGLTSIEWADATWNPVTGCAKISPGCAHCYAEAFAERFRGLTGHPYEQGFDLRLWPERLELPLRWRKARRIFVNSMSDLFHEAVPDGFVADVFDVMERARRHTFLVLTKRPERLAELAPRLPWPSNVWMGVSIENRRFVGRAELLRRVPAAVRFISAEPLLGALDCLDLGRYRLADRRRRERAPGPADGPRLGSRSGGALPRRRRGHLREAVGRPLGMRARLPRRSPARRQGRRHGLLACGPPRPRDAGHDPARRRPRRWAVMLERRYEFSDFVTALELRAYVDAVRSCRHVWSDPVSDRPGGAEYRFCLFLCGRAWWSGELEPGSSEEVRQQQERERTWAAWRGASGGDQ